MIPALAVVLVFGGLIFVHELGHFLAAKWAGVAVSEFALGFGPRLAGWRRAETEYSLRLLPLGGFVRMAGMGAEGEAAPPVPGSGFGDKPLAWRVGIIAAGPFMNFLLASLLFTVIFGVVGVPRRPTLVLDRVEPGSPAAAVGLRPGDRIVAVDGRPVEAWSDVQARVSRSAGVALRVEVERDGRRLAVVVVPRLGEGGRGQLGILPVMEVERLKPLHAIWEGIASTGRIVGQWFGALALMVRGAEGPEVLGPVGIGQQIGQATRMGLSYLLSLAGIISANLGLVNLLPIPALDGSRLVFLLLEGVRGRPVDPAKENLVHFVGFALLMLLTLAITYRDVARLGFG